MQTLRFNTSKKNYIIKERKKSKLFSVFPKFKTDRPKTWKEIY